MARAQVGVFVALVFGLAGLCLAGAPGRAQTAEAAPPAATPASPTKAPAKKPAHKAAKASVTGMQDHLSPTAQIAKPGAAKSKGLSSLDAAVEADKAARLEEGRKKFFEQTTGFDDSRDFGTGPTSSGGGSPSSGLGIKF